ncbi:cytidine deaminase-like protein [Hypoxylon trugodes]|uniref:cytidine deaminase-like protein n=1 Tax=Hypoxylon trugodes TaxID=326681 RepID=UPI0021981723|nr:cytidine deaminase-like protein [Hypoxylon trugodes]KAI1382983.1 cytidine deaminase-like protein [Hypoxylon trugodes]
MAVAEAYPTIAPGDHKAFMEHALDAARRAPSGPDKFCVGACLVDEDTGKILSTGYSLELPSDRPGDPGRVHAEHCCFVKIADQHGVEETRIGDVLPTNTVLYTTMEPCNSRLTGNKPCVERILGLSGAIKTIYVGIREPDTFKVVNSGQHRLEKAGIRMVFVEGEGLQDRILEVSMTGHGKKQ